MGLSAPAEALPRNPSGKVLKRVLRDQAGHEAPGAPNRIVGTARRGPRIERSLGVLIARASGMPLSAFMRERIFEPLGMNDMGFTVPEAKLERVATCYRTDGATGEITVLDEARADLLARPCAFESGAGTGSSPPQTISSRSGG